MEYPHSKCYQSTANPWRVDIFQCQRCLCSTVHPLQAEILSRLCVRCHDDDAEARGERIEAFYSED